LGPDKGNKARARQRQRDIGPSAKVRTDHQESFSNRSGALTPLALSVLPQLAVIDDPLRTDSATRRNNLANLLGPHPFRCAGYVDDGGKARPATTDERRSSAALSCLRDPHFNDRNYASLQCYAAPT